jgi:hypothetical protein
MSEERLKAQALAEIERSEVYQTLLEIPAFQSWMDDEFEDARDRCVRVVENHSSNYEKAMAAGILRYWRAKRSEIERVATKEYRQKRTKRLEDLNGERTSKSGPASFIKAYGQF